MGKNYSGQNIMGKMGSEKIAGKIGAPDIQYICEESECKLESIS